MGGLRFVSSHSGVEATKDRPPVADTVFSVLILKGHCILLLLSLLWLRRSDRNPNAQTSNEYFDPQAGDL